MLLSSRRLFVDMYKLELRIRLENYTSSGKTLIEALENLKGPKSQKVVSVLTIIKGEERMERILPAVITARLFSPSPLMREIAIKNLSLITS